MKILDMHSKKSSPTLQCHSYATCANRSKADAKFTSNEKRRKLMRSTWLGLAFTRSRYLTDFQKNSKCNSSFVTISNNILRLNKCIDTSVILRLGCRLIASCRLQTNFPR